MIPFFFFHSHTSIFITLFSLFFLSACKDNATVKKQRMYYDIHELLEQQPNLLYENNQVFLKKSTFQNKRDTQTLHLHSEQWKKELILFHDIQINKPAYLGNYDSLIESTKEGYTITYQQKPDREFPLRSLVLQFTKNKKITFAEALFLKTNFLYTHEKKLQVTFTPSRKTPIMTHYTIAGYEKVIFLEKTTYHIDALCINNCF
ncbi:MAG: hypothetical protein QM536_01900 [Chitinophagaceae bacterium]|nr:hypothetical protein [Chitinophagaceae bacterium]